MRTTAGPARTRRRPWRSRGCSPLCCTSLARRRGHRSCAPAAAAAQQRPVQAAPLLHARRGKGGPNGVLGLPPGRAQLSPHADAVCQQRKLARERPLQGRGSTAEYKSGACRVALRRSAVLRRVQKLHCARAGDDKVRSAVLVSKGVPARRNPQPQLSGWPPACLGCRIGALHAAVILACKGLR